MVTKEQLALWKESARYGIKDETNPFERIAHERVLTLIAEVERSHRLEEAVRQLRDSQARRINPAWAVVDSLLAEGE